MYVLEVAVQGVRGFAQNGRISLKPGYLILQPQAVGTVPLCGLVSALCFSDGRGGDAVYLAPGQKAGKAGLSLVGNDGLTYRLVRELGGAGALHRLDKASGQFQVVTQDATETAQFLRSQVGMPPKTTFEQLFCFTKAQWPSARPRPKQAGAALAPKPTLASQAQVAASEDLARSQAHLAELEKELATAQQVDQVQYKVDGLSSQLFELEAKLKGGDGLKSAIKDAEAAHAKAPTAESLKLPGDILLRAERFPQLTQRRDEALAKLEGDRLQAEAQSQAPSYVEPVWRDARFLAGVVAGVGALALGAFLEGYARYLALLDIPAFGFAALVALKYVEDLQAMSRVSRKGDFLAAREKKIREEFDAETKVVREAISAAGLEGPSELIELLGRKPLLADKLADLKAQLTRFEQDPEYASAAVRFAQLKAEQEGLNQKLLQIGGYSRDAREVERELARVRQAIAKAQAASPELVAPAAAAGPAEAFEDPTPQVLLLGADLLASDVPGVGVALRDRVAQYLVAFTDRRYPGVEFDKNGKGFVLLSGRKVPVGELPARDLDLYYLSLRLSLIERHAARYKVPALIEELPALDGPKVALLGRMLKHLGTLTQVLHLSSEPALPALADLSVKV